MIRNENICNLYKQLLHKVKPTCGLFALLSQRPLLRVTSVIDFFPKKQQSFRNYSFMSSSL